MPPCLVRSEEVQCFEYFVWQWISKHIDTSAYRADRNRVILIDIDGRFGGGKRPTDIFSDSLEECLCELRRNRQCLGHRSLSIFASVVILPEHSQSVDRAERSRG